MKKYEAVFIIKPDLSEEERKNLFNQISESITKNNGQVSGGSVWAERKKLYFPIKKQQEGLYYFLNFTLPPAAVKELRHAYNLNENILRVLITNLE